MDITIRNILTNRIYNDLGFRVGDKVMLLVEQQSSWTMNILVRAFLYLAQTYHDYFEEQNVDLYRSKKIHLPKPELYMLFTGERADKVESISLSKEFFGGMECALEVRVKVLYGGKGNDILSQYVAFTKVYNEQVKKYGRSREAVTETIQICKGKDILQEFLANREREVITIMMALFDEEKIMRTYVAAERREAARKAARETKEAVENLLKAGKMSAEEIAGCFSELSVEDVREIEKELSEANV